MKPVILIARPRSGTTALRGIVSNHPMIAALGEIFHDSYLGDPRYYYHYYIQEVTKNPALALPSGENRILLFASYIENIQKSLLASEVEKDWLFLGVNYNSLHSLNTYWQNIYEVPYLMHIIKWRNYHVVHMIRRNILATAVSEMRAKLTGIWHLKDGEERPVAADAKITIDPAGFIDQLHTRALEIRLVEAALKEHPRCLTLDYEAFFDAEGRPVPKQLDRLTEFLKLPEPLKAVPTYSRTRSATLRNTIENYDDVAAVIKETEFARYLDAE